MNPHCKTGWILRVAQVHPIKKSWHYLKKTKEHNIGPTLEPRVSRRAQLTKRMRCISAFVFCFSLALLLALCHW